VTDPALLASLLRSGDSECSPIIDLAIRAQRALNGARVLALSAESACGVWQASFAGRGSHGGIFGRLKR
jgi:hypothetical protein